MTGDQPISWLMFFTFAAVIFVIAGFSIRHLHSQRNRDIAKNALAGDGSTKVVAPEGAGFELVGVTVLVLVAMGMLALGASSH